MGCIRRYITLLLFATFVLADYFIDNGDTSVIYSAPASESGGWQIFSVSTRSLVLSFGNSSGTFNITLDASHCYDQNYSLEVCGTDLGCSVEIPFKGSGITMYVFNAGLSGMTASFSIDGGTAVSNTIAAPLPPTFQVSRVSLYDIQGLPSGNHTIKMTLLDWEGHPTSMKFDYAHVNETFVPPPSPITTTTTTPSASASSQTSTQTSTSTGNSADAHIANVGSIVGAALGGLALLTAVTIGILYLRKPKTTTTTTTTEDVLSTPESTFRVIPFPSEFDGSPTPLVRSAILRDALAAADGDGDGGNQNQSVRSVEPGGDVRRGSTVERKRPSQIVDIRPLASAPPSTDVEAGSASHASDLSRYYNSLTPDQVEIIDRLRVVSLPPDTISRVIEGFASSSAAAGEIDRPALVREGSFASAVPPPSYQSRDGG